VVEFKLRHYPDPLSLTSSLAYVYNGGTQIHFKRSGESHATQGKRNLEGRA
jgi:hypothetical protein